MTDLAVLIRERIEAAYSPKQMTILDDGGKHIGHKAHRDGASHFTVIVSTEWCQHLNRIERERCIHSLFLDLMPDSIHALSIKWVSL